MSFHSVKFNGRYYLISFYENKDNNQMILRGRRYEPVDRLVQLSR
jgi:hypothetical protein